MNYSHFIITQFNLRNFPLSDNDDYDKWISWTRNRISLFREYCLPSLVNQSSKAFTWLLYFDSATPDELRHSLDFLDQYPFIKICHCNGFEGFNENYISEVTGRLSGSEKWVITTRVDNDDCLHKDAVKTIQENFVEKHGFLISLASGYILNIADRTMSHYYYPMSPFISLIENTGTGIRGIFMKGHTKWDSLRLFAIKEIWLEFFKRKARNSRFILKKPLWIQLFHGGNVSNSFYRGLPVVKSRHLGDFALNFNNESQPLKSILKYPHYVTWKRYFKSHITRMILNK